MTFENSKLGKIKFFIFIIFLPKVQNSKLWSFMFQPQFNNVRNTRTHNFFLFFHPLSDFEISKLIIFHFSNNFSIFVFSLNLGTLESHFTGFPFYREKIASSNLWESHFTEIPFDREYTVACAVNLGILKSKHDLACAVNLGILKPEDHFGVRYTETILDWTIICVVYWNWCCIWRDKKSSGLTISNIIIWHCTSLFCIKKNCAARK